MISSLGLTILTFKSDFSIVYIYLTVYYDSATMFILCKIEVSSVLQDFSYPFYSFY